MSSEVHKPRRRTGVDKEGSTKSSLELPRGYTGLAKWITSEGNLTVIIKSYFVENAGTIDETPLVTIELAIPGQLVGRLERPPLHASDFRITELQKKEFKKLKRAEKKDKVRRRQLGWADLP